MNKTNSGYIRQQRRLVEEWTQLEGTLVDVKMDNGEVKRTRTRSRSVLVGGDSAYVLLDGVVGYYPLDRVQVAVLS